MSDASFHPELGIEYKLNSPMPVKRPFALSPIASLSGQSIYIFLFYFIMQVKIIALLSVHEVGFLLAPAAYAFGAERIDYFSSKLC
ncbi:hypothetical protein ACFPOH_15315 [Ureibacillus suwonensis]|uniref:Uncharacterized protein n=1 Tax=Ureibacillus suwonensis TaxID=313007 RepID=A0ABW0RGA7_9BACL